MDIHLHYREEGSGYPLILLRGNNESSAYFFHQIKFFSKFYRVIAVDTRGHGFSPRGTAEFTLVQFAEDLHDFMDERGIDKAHILGFSDGANVALLLALKYPEWVERLILNGADLDTGGVKASVQIPIEIAYGINHYLAGKSSTAGKKAEMLGLMHDQPNINPRELGKLEIRTLVIAGTKDMIKESHTRLIFESLPNAVLKFIQGNHFIAAKNPGAFNRAVKEFLE
ncbi:MAG: alpha/beta hydrolase [Clostridia bacterium]|nr:alpha/beta hydrolase [Clostridia bacterium]NCD03978.1 alpha/beta hydrolase [Clostridia bacterium]